MSEPIHEFDKHIISAGDMTADVTSPALLLDTVSIVNIQSAWTGTPTGNLYLEGRNDSSMPYTIIDSLAIAGASGDIMINMETQGCAEVRVRYAHTSGTGILNSFANGKKRS